MGKTAEPDKKQIDKAVKSVKDVCDKLQECTKDLTSMAKLAKELDKIGK